MGEALSIIAIILLIVVIILVTILLARRATTPSLEPLLARLDFFEKSQQRTESIVREEIAANRAESGEQGRKQREEIDATLKATNDTLVRTLGELSLAQGRQLEAFAARLSQLIDSNEKRLSELRAGVEQKLAQLSTENAQKLEEMRRTVDEKLQGTLERRLSESFRVVSERLEQVHKGLGEMQVLATGVGDLKKVLSNVKTRGTWGEIQLGMLLEQVLSPEQFARDVRPHPDRNEIVEFAVRLPGHDDQAAAPIWLPIDAKFPIEDYQRLSEAAERGDVDAVEAAARQLEAQIKACARDIHEKYIAPPYTTDFAILFLPSEGLYAEVLRRPGLAEHVQLAHRVSLAGPTTLAALLNSLQMGFRTLAIQKRSSEVWKLLAAVKTEFGKFGEVIAKVKKKLDEAGSAVDAAATRTRVIERKLRGVQELPAGGEPARLEGVELTFDPDPIESLDRSRRQIEPG